MLEGGDGNEGNEGNGRAKMETSPIDTSYQTEIAFLFFVCTIHEELKVSTAT